MKKQFNRGFKKGLLKRHFKRLLKVKWYNLSKKQERLIIKDVKHFPDALIDYLFEYFPTTPSEIEKQINDWCSLEQAMMNLHSRKKYKMGNGKNYFKLLVSQMILWDVKSGIEI